MLALSHHSIHFAFSKLRHFKRQPPPPATVSTRARKTVLSHSLRGLYITSTLSTNVNTFLAIRARIGIEDWKICKLIFQIHFSLNFTFSACLQGCTNAILRPFRIRNKPRTCAISSCTTLQIHNCTFNYTHIQPMSTLNAFIATATQHTKMHFFLSPQKNLGNKNTRLQHNTNVQIFRHLYAYKSSFNLCAQLSRGSVMSTSFFYFIDTHETINKRAHIFFAKFMCPHFLQISWQHTFFLPAKMGPEYGTMYPFFVIKKWIHHQKKVS